MVSDPEGNKNASDRRTFPAAVVDAVSRFGDRRAARKHTKTSVSDDSGRRFGGAEFWLVVIMLLILSALVLAVLYSPPIVVEVESQDGQATIQLDDREMANDVFEYRRTILAVIITAFGAWVGAGAAYFFGRENMREATRTMLQMREPSAKDRLLKTPVRDIPPLPLDWKPDTEAKLSVIFEKLKACPEYWFIPVFKEEDGQLKTVLEEEAFWRYLYDVCEIGQAANKRKTADAKRLNPQPLQDVMDELLGRNLGELVSYAERTPDIKSEFHDIYVPCNMEQSAADVYRKMQLGHRDLRLAIVFDDDSNPTHFFTTTEVRRLLLDIF